MARRIAVLHGGWSVEREVSLVSGKAVAAALREAGLDTTLIDVRRDLPALAAALEPRPDAVFNALHGRGGEDGVVQGVLEMLGLPYTHSGVTASAVAMDKRLTRQVLHAAGLPVPPGRALSKEEALRGHPLPPPYVLKPVAEGSSVGVRIVPDGAAGPGLTAADWPYGEQVLAESFIPGRELTVTVMGAAAEARALAVTEIRALKGFYDYGAKYTAGRAVHDIPAAVPEPVTTACLDMATRAHRELGCAGVSRVDFRWDDGRGGIDGLFVLEVNTQPGMTPLSLVPEQAAYRGLDFKALCLWLVERASCWG